MTKIFFNGGDGEIEVEELHIRVLGESLMSLEIKTKSGSSTHVGYFKATD